MRTGRVVGILQARMSSKRLPGKVLKMILGRPMLARQLERVARCAALDQLIVATSKEETDDPIESLCQSVSVRCYRGSLDDVLDRFYQCAHSAEASHVVRLTGDCPLADPNLIAELVDFYREQDADYASNCRPPTLPDGLDAEVFSIAALDAAWRESVDPYEREHVVPFILRRPERFATINWKWKDDLSDLRWTVDELEDFEFVTRVYEYLFHKTPNFDLNDVLMLIQQHPQLKEINGHFLQNEASKRT